jgi:uncharacterized Ntn-hydrolase superfamily protein
MAETICNERHKNIDSRLDTVENDIRELRAIQMEQGLRLTETTVTVKDVNNSVKTLARTAWAMLILFFTSAVGFIIWYIESLPR